MQTLAISVKPKVADRKGAGLGYLSPAFPCQHAEKSLLFWFGLEPVGLLVRFLAGNHQFKATREICEPSDSTNQISQLQTKRAAPRKPNTGPKIGLSVLVRPVARIAPDAWSMVRLLGSLHGTVILVGHGVEQVPSMKG